MERENVMCVVSSSVRKVNSNQSLEVAFANYTSFFNYIFLKIQMHAINWKLSWPWRGGKNVTCECDVFTNTMFQHNCSHPWINNCRPCHPCALSSCSLLSFSWLMFSFGASRLRVACVFGVWIYMSLLTPECSSIHIPFLGKSKTSARIFNHGEKYKYISSQFQPYGCELNNHISQMWYFGVNQTTFARLVWHVNRAFVQEATPKKKLVFSIWCLLESRQRNFLARSLAIIHYMVVKWAPPKILGILMRLISSP